VALTIHPPTGAEVHERVQLRLYYPSGSLWRCPRVKFTFTFYESVATKLTNDQQHLVQISYTEFCSIGK